MKGNENTTELQISLSTHKAWWWIYEYDVTREDDNYITAVQNDSKGHPVPNVGATVFVLDRVTGIMKMAEIAIFTDDNHRNPELLSKTYELRCVKPVL